MKSKGKLLLAGYLLVAAITYGYAYKVELNYQNSLFPKLEQFNRTSAQVYGFVSAFAWPVYWPFHWSRILWSNTNPSQQKAEP